jgi:hypothetical protein
MDQMRLRARRSSADAVVPRIIAAGPETLIDLLLLKQPGTDDYVGASMDRELSGLQRVAVRV